MLSMVEVLTTADCVVSPLTKTTLGAKPTVIA